MGTEWFITKPRSCSTILPIPDTLPYHIHTNKHLSFLLFSTIYSSILPHGIVLDLIDEVQDNVIRTVLGAVGVKTTPKADTATAQTVVNRYTSTHNHKNKVRVYCVCVCVFCFMLIVCMYACMYVLYVLYTYIYIWPPLLGVAESSKFLQHIPGLPTSHTHSPPL